MSDLSPHALDLLQTVKKRGKKHSGMGTYFTKRDIAYWYHNDSDEELLNTDDLDAINELLHRKIASIWRDEDDEFILTPQGENYRNQPHAPGTTIITNTITGNTNSPITNMSSRVSQVLSQDEYSVEINKKVDELHDAIIANDSDRARRIIDGLWVSSPQLVLSILQLGLSFSGGRES